MDQWRLLVSSSLNTLWNRAMPIATRCTDWRGTRQNCLTLFDKIAVNEVLTACTRRLSLDPGGRTVVASEHVGQRFSQRGTKFRSRDSRSRHCPPFLGWSLPHAVGPASGSDSRIQGPLLIQQSCLPGARPPRELRGSQLTLQLGRLSATCRGVQPYSWQQQTAQRTSYEVGHHKSRRRWYHTKPGLSNRQIWPSDMSSDRIGQEG